MMSPLVVHTSTLGYAKKNGHVCPIIHRVGLVFCLCILNIAGWQNLCLLALDWQVGTQWVYKINGMKISHKISLFYLCIIMISSHVTYVHHMYYSLTL